MPDVDGLREKYEREYREGKWGRILEQALGVEIDRRAMLVTSLAACSGGGTLLDVGFGDGRFLDSAKRLGWKTVGTEVTYSAASLGAFAHSRIVGGLAAIREDGLFDAITFFDVLEHLRDPGDALRQARARLREQGLLVVTMPNLRGTTGILAGSHWPYYEFAEYGHIHHLAPRHIRMLLGRAGFERVWEETRGSVDLRDLPAMYGLAVPTRVSAWVLDKGSGLLARLAERLGFGNTLLIAARKTRYRSRTTSLRIGTNEDAR